jgi:hypothetical protein
MDAKEKEEIVEEVLRRVWHRIAWGIVLIPIAYLIGDFALRAVKYLLH